MEEDLLSRGTLYCLTGAGNAGQAEKHFCSPEAEVGILAGQAG